MSNAIQTITKQSTTNKPFISRVLFYNKERNVQTQILCGHSTLHDAWNAHFLNCKNYKKEQPVECPIAVDVIEANGNEVYHCWAASC